MTAKNTAKTATGALPETEQCYQKSDAINPEDLCESILRQCMAMAPGFTAAVAAAVDQRVRAEWGNTRAHITSTLGGKDAAFNARNAALMRDWQRGERIELLARRYQISRRRVEQIIAANRVVAGR